MIDFLRDPFWQFVGALLALVTIFLTIYIFIRERSKKALTYEITSFFPFLTIDEEAKGDLRVTYKGDEITDLFLVGIHVINSGNVPITSNDYEKPISFILGEEAKIYSAEVVETHPKTLSCNLTIEGNKVILSPTLFNSGDTLNIKCLVTSPSNTKILGEARIVGVKNIEEKRTNPERYMGWAIIGLILMTISFLFGLVAIKPSLTIDKVMQDWPVYLLIFLGMALAFGGLTLYLIREGLRSFFGFLWTSLTSIFSRE